MIEQTIRLHVTAAWDDGTLMEGDVEVSHDSGPAVDSALSCNLAVAGSPTDDDAPELLRASITAALDVALAEVVVIGDLDGAIDLLVRQLLGFATVATKAQEDKWRRFQRRPGAGDAAAVLTRYLLAVGHALPGPALGGNWGVTVMNEGAVIRLNVGDAEVFTVRDDGRIVVACQGEPPDVVPPYALRIGPGLKKAPPTYALWIDFAWHADAFADEHLRTTMVERIQAVWRRMPKANYHNPLAEVLLPEIRPDDVA